VYEFLIVNPDKVKRSPSFLKRRSQKLLTWELSKFQFELHLYRVQRDNFPLRGFGVAPQEFTLFDAFELLLLLG
jgi:hypothetical protein